MLRAVQLGEKVLVLGQSPGFTFAIALQDQMPAFVQLLSGERH